MRSPSGWWWIRPRGSGSAAGVQRLRSTCVRLWHSGWCLWHACLRLQTGAWPNSQTSGSERRRRKGICIRWGPITKVGKARWQATRRLDANSVAARQALDLGRHSSAHASGLLCERDGSLRWCSSWTGDWSEDSQIRSFGTDRSPVSTDRRRDTWPVESVIDRFLFGAGPQDSVYFRRQPRAQLSFPAHFHHYSAL